MYFQGFNSAAVILGRLIEDFIDRNNFVGVLKYNLKLCHQNMKQ